MFITYLNPPPMFRNYFRIAIRNIVKHKAFAFINISGLAIGMACSIFILLWVQNELSYDRFHANADRIYRLTGDAGDFKAAVNCAPMAVAMSKEFPEISNAIRFSHPSTHVLEVGEKKFEEKRIFYADSTFFEIFSFPLVKGDMKKALARPDAILISEDAAIKYFGNNDVIGKILKKDNNKNVVVTGVLKNIPSNSHLQFDFIMPMSAIAQENNDLKNNTWTNFNFYAYVQLAGGIKATTAELRRIEANMDDLFKRNVGEVPLKVKFGLQPLTDIHLTPGFQVDLPGHGDRQYVNIFFVIAIFILVVASINYMNLATARSARRAKEVGLRKVVGAGKGQLIGQFLGESIMISLISLVLACAVVWFLLPAFNNLAGKKIDFGLLDGKLLIGIAAMAILTGLVSGSYPAFFLSGFQPVKVLKGDIRSAGGNLWFRNTLVVTQFVVSIILLAGTAVVYQQLRYIRTMNLGFDKSNLLYVEMRGELWSRQEALKNELRSNPLTAGYAIVNDLPINLISGTVSVEWEGKDPNKQIVFPTLHVSEEFFDVFQMEILNGRGFSKDFKADTGNYVLNERAATVMGFSAATAVGKPLTLWGQKGTIIGVVKDFNFKPVQQPIEPMILGLNRWGGVVVVRTQPGKTEETISNLEQITRKLNPAYPFSYDFLDQNIAKLYQGEQRMGSLFNVFAILAILISSMGLYGLSAFITEQRTKEIGVRKVLGASVLNVVYLLSGRFTKLILVSVLIAVPVAWLAVNNWLQTFAYHIDVNWMVFAGASAAALAIAWLTISYESIKAAISNPTKSLRNE
jgi:putative ABC transport system permease protein